jgi:hypothetical protein
MTSSLSASRVVAGDPASALLLISGPAAAGFLPDAILTETRPGQVAGVVRLAADRELDIQVTTAAPRRTPTAYISEFRLHVDGMPASIGALTVTSAGPGRSNVVFSLRSEEDIPEELADAFSSIAARFFDGLERAAQEQNPAA